MQRPADRSIAVVVPSRLAGGAGRKLFVEQAIEAAGTQAIQRGFHLAFFIGIDLDAQIPSSLGARPDVTLARSQGRSQASAINAAANAAAAQNHDFIALLEDDDQWEPNFLAWALACLESCDFVSSNQLEVDAEERCVRVNDFPTPSGWIMAADLWRKVGPFDESLRWHVDNDWLGRLALSGARRVHLVEATAPITLQSSAQVRPWIANVLTQGGPGSTVRRHLSSRPLVRRTVHQGSGMHQIATNPMAAAESQSEYRQLISRYGRIPW
ncbi:MAG: glycosyltransferase family 2 protein [Methylovirgula sp.]|nr:glycosyltransferase family 2 protein [Methylovirgula sp.]